MIDVNYSCSLATTILADQGQMDGRPPRFGFSSGVLTPCAHVLYS